MLVLSRKKNESIVLDDDLVIIKVAKISPDKVSLDIGTSSEISTPQTLDTLNLELPRLENKNGKLEDSVSQIPLKKTLYQQFQEQLQKKDYLKASYLYDQCSTLVTPNESKRLIKGLSKYTTSLKNKLKKYEEE